jgi:tetratricopeptide (TPR) repeat protein
MAGGILILLCLPAAAGDRPASKRAMSFLQLGAGPRAYAMGEAFSGLADDVTALFWNPAGLGQLSYPEIFFMHNQWIQNLRQEYLAVACPLAGGCAAAQITYLNSDIQLCRDAEGNLTGHSFNPYSLMGGLGYGYNLGSGLLAGGSINYAREQLDDTTYATICLDISGLYRPKDAWWSVGMVVRNLGAPVAGYPLPLTMRLGAAGQFFRKSLNVSLDIARTIPGWFRYGFGAEYWYKNIFAVRSGYLFRPEQEGLDNLSGLRAGLGFNIQGYQLDYAMIPQGDLGYGHRAGFTYFFGGGRALASEKQALIDKARQQGQKALAAQDYDLAVDGFQKVLSFIPNDPAARQGLAAAQTGLRQQEKAHELKRRINQAEKYVRSGLFKDAMDEYQRVLLIDEGNTRAARALDKTRRIFQSGTITKHLKAGRKAYQLQKWVDAMQSWQAVLAIDSQHKEAKKMLKKTRDQLAKGSMGFKDPRIRKLYLAGLKLFEKGDYGGATKKWTQVLKLAPKHKQAKQYLQQALRLLEQIIKQYLQAGDKYLTAGDPVRAAGSWRKILKLSPQHTEAKKRLQEHKALFQKHAKELYLKGIELYTQAHFKRAIANWQDVLTLAPDYAGAADNIKKAGKKIKALR